MSLYNLISEPIDEIRNLIWPRIQHHFHVANVPIVDREGVLTATGSSVRSWWSTEDMTPDEKLLYDLLFKLNDLEGNLFDE